MTTATARPRAIRRRPEWLVPAGLIALSLVPIVAGSARLTQLTTGAAVTAENARFFDSPIPVVAHIIGSSVFLVLGALQFAPSLRRRRWHRIAGRIVAPSGLVSALSALWMTVFYDIPSPLTGPGLPAIRIVLGTTMAATIVVAFVAIRRGDVRTHSAWMTRAYAIGMGAGTQVLVFLPYTLLVGAPAPVTYTLLMAAGWAINLVIAELVIRRRTRTGRRRSGAPMAATGAHLS
ncbi:putative membrane protein [Microbacterium trichothecenolyticum]|uniref:DUF2306 domain-containing protein n=1 Tax=Microbacterium trichothecenolyticum TaxID=69370 RepID=UPI002854EC8E|nr:DUF2306 domain-containing protein [Microbacterium trichothecenolyticum]MDR7184367.1 putative membrane protein [Microbacterium trichothecenolyticum]